MPHTLGGVCQNSTKRQNQSFFSTVIYTISPGSWGSMAKSRPATAARGPQARGLPWRAEMQPNCPGYQERLCLSSWNRYSTRTGKARKNRTRKESFLARKNDRNVQPCEILQISALGRRFAISHGSNQLFSAGEASSGPKFKGTCEIAESRNVHPSI